MLKSGQAYYGIIGSSHKNESTSEHLVVKIHGKELDNTTNIHDTFTKILHFPSYYGRNWDALDEVMNDLDWLKVRKLFLILENPKHILNTDLRSREIFFKILKRALENSKGGSNPEKDKWDEPYLTLIFEFINESEKEDFENETGFELFTFRLINFLIKMNNIINTLKLIATDGNVQIELFPKFVVVADEIAIMYADMVNLNNEEIQKFEPAVKKIILDIDGEFAKQSEKENNDFWTNESIKTGVNWISLRDNAKQVLKLLAIEYTKPIIQDNYIPSSKK